LKLVDPQPSSPQPTFSSPAELEVEIARLHQEYCAELLSFAVSIIRNEDAARDAVQEAFLRYFVERNYGRAVEYPRAWLYRVVRNYLLDRMDAAAAKHEVGQDEAVDLPDRNHGPEEKLRCAQMAQQLTTLLSPREMECLRLRADGLSYDQIACVLRIRPGTVSALLTRVHKKLRSAALQSEDCRSGTMEALSFLIGGGGAYSTP
jgi:RNA polymerase sigma-70 factor (ECF subfamily)